MRRVLFIGGFLFQVLFWNISSVYGDGSAYFQLKNLLFQYERYLYELNHNGKFSDEKKRIQSESLRKKIEEVKNRLKNRFSTVDLELGESIDAVQSQGMGWLLRILTHGKFTGKPETVHKPLPAIGFSQKLPEKFHGKPSKPGLGYPLLVVLGNDPICREAYAEFLARIEATVKSMEQKIGEAYDYGKPKITPNQIGFGFREFWKAAFESGEKTANRYFWKESPREVRKVGVFLALMSCAALANNITIDEDTDNNEELWRRAVWRKNALPWRTSNPQELAGRCDSFHFFSHAWLTFFQLYLDTFFRNGKIVSGNIPPEIPALALQKALLVSKGSGIGYEFKTMKSKGGFLEKSAASKLPKTLKKVAQFFGLSEVPFFEAFRDIDTNSRGANFGAASFLSGNNLDPLDTELHKSSLHSGK